jgi:hypothetical protein
MSSLRLFSSPLPSLAAIICGLFVYFLNKTSAAHASTKSDWSDVQIGGGGGGGGVLSIVQNDAELENVKNIGIVLEYNDLALEAHARKGKISQSQMQRLLLRSELRPEQLLIRLDFACLFSFRSEQRERDQEVHQRPDAEVRPSLRCVHPARQGGEIADHVHRFDREDEEGDLAGARDAQLGEEYSRHGRRRHGVHGAAGREGIQGEDSV